MEPFIANGHDIIVGAWITLGAPRLFVSLGLAQRKAREEAIA